jgi:DegT/DnrJ/EryC1/StrS aminotransferase family
MGLSAEPKARIEAALRERTGRDCVYVTSGRLGLYVALVASLSPGGRVLVSPLTDDVVLFTLLAAGMRPVMAPTSPEDGNIALEKVPDGAWASLDAVLTTNLFGLPDRLPELRSLCDRHGALLIEDAAHALYTDVGGQAVGTFGELSVFSFSKHAAGVGGAICFGDATRRAELAVLHDRLVERRPVRLRISERVVPVVENLVGRSPAGARLRAAKGRVLKPERQDHRMPLRPELLESALRAAPNLEAFEPWLRVDKHDYRLAQRDDLLSSTARRLGSPARHQGARVEGAMRLLELPAVAPAARRCDPVALFRVPFLVEDRDAAGAALASSGHPFYYVYDPPLDDYAGGRFVEPSPAPSAARWWGSHVLPVDPLLADEVLPVLRSVTPAAPLGVSERA